MCIECDTSSAHGERLVCFKLDRFDARATTPSLDHEVQSQHERNQSRPTLRLMRRNSEQLLYLRPDSSSPLQD